MESFCNFEVGTFKYMMMTKSFLTVASPPSDLRAVDKVGGHMKGEKKIGCNSTHVVRVYTIFLFLVADPATLSCPSQLSHNLGRGRGRGEISPVKRFKVALPAIIHSKLAFYEILLPSPSHVHKRVFFQQK